MAGRQKLSVEDKKASLQLAQDKYRKHNPIKYMFSQTKRRATHRGQEFNIDLSDIVIPEVCPLLGLTLDHLSPDLSSHPSIDRFDSSKGYIKGNVWVISFRANRLKNNATADELYLLASNLKKAEALF